MIGKVVSHYKILEKLGGGGMGVVYKAHDLRLDRPVALKFLPPDLTRDSEAKQRFILEAKAASALQHNNICVVYDIDETPEGQLFISMEYLEGETLKKKIVRGPLKIDEAIDVAIQVDRGLARAHEHGIIHRDIKPANIIITSDGVAKIVDFGLAKLAGPSMLTKSGTILGTVAYMSPEQTKGDPVDSRTDIWSLGVVLYEMVTGQLPFKGDYENAVVYSILNARPEPITALRTGVPMELERIVQKCLAKDPRERYQHADELLVDLKRLQTETVASATPTPPTRRLPRHMWAGIAAVLMVVLIGVWLIWPGKSSVHGAGYDRMKSIGVLPFVPMGKTLDDSIFADGIHEDILTQLSKITDLRVIGRSSMILYRDTKKRLSEIGNELDAGYLMEGSVRKSGGKLRIAAQLVDASTEGHVWADVYDRPEADVFAVQSEIANRIADDLKLRLAPVERASIENVPTSSIKAHEYYLKGEYYWRNYTDSAGNTMAAEMFDSAAHEDPRFVQAFAWSSIVHLALYYYGFDTSPEQLRQSKASLDNALALAPDEPEVRCASGQYYHLVEGDRSRALTEYELALNDRPRWGEVLLDIAIVHQEAGDFEKAREYLRRQRASDPMEISTLNESFLVCERLREWDPAKAEAEQYLSRHPDDPYAYLFLADLLIDGFGDLEGARTILEQGRRQPVSPFRGGDRVDRGSLWRVEFYERRFDSALACAPNPGWNRGLTLIACGNPSEARLCFEGALAVGKGQIDRWRSLKTRGISANAYYVTAQLAQGYAAVGNEKMAIETIQNALETSSQGPGMNRYARLFCEESLVNVYVFLGQKDKALDLIERLLRGPGTLTVWKLRLDPLYDPLRSDRRFQALLARSD